MRLSRRAVASIVGASFLLGSGLVAARAEHGATVHPGPTPKAVCGPNSNPETGLQGRVSAADVASGRASQGYWCNTQLLGRFGTPGGPGSAGGYKVFRYQDAAGHECGYYDSTLLFPLNGVTQPDQATGVYVLDMSNPANPVRTATLTSPAMLSPHESLSLNVARGLLAAGMGYPTTNPGFVDIYDLTDNCLDPQLLSSTPMGILGHEAAFSPDGDTFWVSSTTGHTLTALDVSDPTDPAVLWTTPIYRGHGLNISGDGRRLYLADTGNFGATPAGLAILDVSDVQDRVVPPNVTEIGRLTWDTVSIPQVPIPVTIGGTPYLVEIDEFARSLRSGDPAAPVGAARIIDITDETSPRIVSNIRLEVNMQEHVAETSGDPGARNPLQGYTGHYCAVPKLVNPGIVACTFILSGMRVFDIRDPAHPKEIAYFNGPLSPAHALGAGGAGPGGAYAMSAPAFDAASREIWYSDGTSGFYAVKVVNDAWNF